MKKTGWEGGGSYGFWDRIRDERRAERERAMRELTRDEHHLLDWLDKEETSAVGECKGDALNFLIGEGLALIVEHDGRGRDYDRVSLTSLGREELRKLGPWLPGGKNAQPV